ncbi:CoA transferase [Microcella indica]|uniref:CoA transferase n=1 Tax=Microcella indica TaxID=2750620 RepID=UPI0015CF7342|nr:CoA transferase [Microcella indica]
MTETPAVAVTGTPTLGGAYPVSVFAAQAVGAVGLALARLAEGSGHPAVEESAHAEGASGSVVVHGPLADAWFSAAVRPVQPLASPWDAIAGDYRTADGWIRLHTNAPHHRAVALRVLGVPEPADRAAVAAAVERWTGDVLETEVVIAGGCAAVMRSVEQWSRHPQGIAVAAEPLVAVDVREAGRPLPAGVAERPLAGVRVLDLTRVLAGPVATRVLALLGADVLRVDPPSWNEPSVAPDMTLGKRCTRLDTDDVEDRAELLALLAEADVLVHGYRPGALDSMGLDAATLRRVRPGLVEVQIDAYGYSGPWAGRRGFDSLVQMSSGIAHRGMLQAAAETPLPLPVQALDHATGWFAAAAALRAVARARHTGAGSLSRLSLARTALELESLRDAMLTSQGPSTDATAFATSPAPPTLPGRTIETFWGEALVLDPPLSVAGVRIETFVAPRPLGSDEPEWQSDLDEAPPARRTGPTGPAAGSPGRAVAALGAGRTLVWAFLSAALVWGLQGAVGLLGSLALGGAPQLYFWTQLEWLAGAAAQAAGLAGAWYAASRVVTVAPAVAITTLAGYAASVLVTGAAGALRVGEPIAGESFATVLVVSLSTGAALIAFLVPGLLLFTRWFVGRVSGDQSLARAKYSRS